MSFKFSDKDQILLVHHVDHEGVYLSSEEMLIEANTGLPAQSTIDDLPQCSEGQTCVFHQNKWQVMTDFRGQMAYAKDPHSGQDYEVDALGEITKTHTLLKPGAFDSWCDDSQQWQYDQLKERPIKSVQETQWRDTELTKVLNRIDQYEKDQGYPPELRTSPIQNEEDFLRLLKDRKLLSDYPQCEGFPFGARPSLSGVAT